VITPIEIQPASIPGQTKVVRVSATARKQVVFKLTDEFGKPVDLRAEVPNTPADEPVFGAQPPASGLNVTIRLLAREGDLTGGVYFDITGRLLDQRGFVEFLLDDQHTKTPGIYSATIGRFAGEYLTDTWPVLVHIEHNAFSSPAGGRGPLTIPEVRLHLYDQSNGTDGAPFNNLLDTTEFQDVDISSAMNRVIELWNETPAPTTPIRYTNKSFPYRYWWLVGTTAILLRMSAARYRRNALQYQAGGVAINDQSKANEYEEVAAQRMSEFMDWMRQEKTRLNAERCWGVGL